MVIISRQVLPLHTGSNLSYFDVCPSKHHDSTGDINNNNNTHPKAKKLLPLIFLHGFPDVGFIGFRKIYTQLGHFHRILVPDLRGYGHTTIRVDNDNNITNKDETYQIKNTCLDMIALMDLLAIDKAIFVGHDWGGTCVFNLAVCFPERVAGVVSFCTPFFPLNRNENPWEKMRSKTNHGRFEYQMYYQSDQAIKELNQDIAKTIACMIRGTKDDPLPTKLQHSMSHPIQCNGQLNGNDTNNPHQLKVAGETITIAPSKILSPLDFALYVDTFKHSTFKGPIKWYRNVERNWQFLCDYSITDTIDMPCMMVTAEFDDILRPSMAQNIANHCTHPICELHNVKDANHWILHEKPNKCVVLLQHFCDRIYNEIKLLSQSKL